MIDLSTEAARAWLAARMHVPPDRLRITPLGGGVSNHVLLVETGSWRCVVKQSLGKLRVEQDWFCARERVWRECDALRAMAGLLPPGAVPGILWEERAEFAFAMEAAPSGAEPWKTALLQGKADAEIVGAKPSCLHSVVGQPLRLPPAFRPAKAESPPYPAGEPLGLAPMGPEIAAEAGRLLAEWIRLTSAPEWSERFPGLDVFDDLRLDPYYRAASARHPDLAPAFERAIRRASECRTALVHGDYSPKNLLVHPGGVMIIDWEVIHYGDPAFDAAFLTNHLLLKAIHRSQDWREYHACAEAFWRELPAWHDGALVHLPCLMLARVDGKSPAEYLTASAEKEAVRRAAIQMLKQPPSRVPDLFPWIFA